jgi:hypothetical protein
MVASGIAAKNLELLLGKLAAAGAVAATTFSRFSSGTTQFNCEE